jgi:hypothetical protein
MDLWGKFIGKGRTWNLMAGRVLTGSEQNWGKRSIPNSSKALSAAQASITALIVQAQVQPSQVPD